MSSMRPQAWTIRRASPEDIPGVLSLWRSAGVEQGVSDTADGLSGLLAADRDALLIAEAEQQMLGSLIATWDGWRGNLYRLAVHPDRRREGIATALLHEGERRLAALGALRLSALVTDRDPGALGFWRSAGYTLQADRVRLLRHL
jgi:ribosomal protein S18 acetylase RimI-like enzyme